MSSRQLHNWDRCLSWDEFLEPLQGTHSDVTAPTYPGMDATHPSQRTAQDWPMYYPLGIQDATTTTSPDSDVSESHPESSLSSYTLNAMGYGIDPSTLLDGFGNILDPSGRSSEFQHKANSQHAGSNFLPLVSSTSNAFQINDIPGPLTRYTLGQVVSQVTYIDRTSNKRNQVPLEEPIKFSVQGNPGFPLKHALEKNYRELDDRDEEMLVNASANISIRLESTDYPSWSRQIKTHDWSRDRRPISRAKLATEIAKVIDRFVKEMRERSGSCNIDTNRLALTALNQVSKSSWQPELFIISSEHDF